jgi:glyoxylate reductase
MARNRPHVVVTRKLPDAIETRMMELFQARLNEADKPMDKAELAEAVKACDVLVPTVTDRIDSAVLAHAGERLRLIANYGTGVDNIDVEAAYKRGITVTNTPGVLTEDTADMTMALILAVSRRLAEGERLARSGEWDGWRPTAMLGRRIWGKRLGILGMGRIGSAVARRPRASASPSTTTTAAASTRTWRTSWRRPTGRASTRCWPASTSSPSTPRTRPGPTTSSPPAAWPCSSRTRSWSTPAAAR